MVKNTKGGHSGKAGLDHLDGRHGWHPFTQMQEYCSVPQVHVASGKGCWLYDTEGRAYLDTNASIWTNVHGHNDADLNRALSEQAGKVAHSTWLGLSHPIGARFGAELARMAPGELDRVIFSDNGSNAVEIALKLSFQYWQLVGRPEKRLMIGMENAYHGDTFGTMSVGGNETFHGRFAPWMFEKRTIPAPHCREWGNREREADSSASLAALKALLEAESDQIAGLVLEPWIQGAAGMRLQPKGFLQEAAGLCAEHDVHLILDEVFVGFGRTGEFFVCEQEGVTPDFLCLAKGLSAGYLPLAATLTRESIYEAFLGSFESFRAFFHGHTFTANPLAAAVSMESARKLEQLIASGALRETIEYFGRCAEAAFAEHPHVAEIRQRGLVCAVDLKPAHGGAQARYPLHERRGLEVAVRARGFGLLLRSLADTLLIVPPLVIGREEIDFLFENTREAVEACLQGT
ncbi:MAG: adenosylmethionine--8-amino-7-oxononanoate transaminase [Opitutales bacterium]